MRVSRPTATGLLHREELFDAVTAALAKGSADSWFEALTERGVPCGPLNDIADAIALAERLNLDPVVSIDDPRRDAPTRQVANPIRYEPARRQPIGRPRRGWGRTAFPLRPESVDPSESATGIPVADLRVWPTQLTFRTSFPVFAPAKRRLRLSPNASIPPSTTCSRAVNSPLLIHFPICSCASA